MSIDEPNYRDISPFSQGEIQFDERFACKTEGDLIDQDSLRFYRDEASKYTSLVQFFEDHALDNGKKAIDSCVITEERFRELYERDVKKLALFDLYELEGKVNSIAENFPQFKQKAIEEIVKNRALKARRLTDKESWKELNEDLEGFSKWAKGHKISNEKISTLEAIDEDYEIAKEQMQRQSAAQNRWFSTRIFFFNVNQTIKNIYTALVNLVTKRDAGKAKLIVELESSIKSEASLSYKMACDANRKFRDEVKRVNKEFSIKTADIVFVQSAVKAWSGNEATHQIFLDRQIHAIEEIESLSKTTDVMISSLGKRGVSNEERWKRELLDLGKYLGTVQGTLSSNIEHIIEYLSMDKFPDGPIDLYTLLMIHPSKSADVCIKAAPRLEGILADVLGKDSLILERMKRAKANLQSEAFQEARRIHRFKSLHAESTPKDFANILTGRTYVPTKGHKSDKEVLSAFKARRLLLHPDKLVGKGFNEEEIKYVSEALIILQNMHDIYKARAV